MPEELVNEIDLLARATKVEVRFAHEGFNRPVRKIVLCGVPHKDVDGSVKDVGVLVIYEDGTSDTFYVLMSARRPLGADDPNELCCPPVVS